MIAKIPEGALTALVTPFDRNENVDWMGFSKLVEFQVRQGISGIVPVGTTGESATVTESEQEEIFSEALSREDVFVLAGCGSNCTREARHYVQKTAELGGRAVLLVDPYYLRAASLNIRRNYYEPISKEFSEMAIVPYIIPGRTGCATLPEDLAELNVGYPNIVGVKEASGDLVRMELTRKLTALASPGFQIFAGDDDKTYHMMASSAINACGVISVVSNIAPAAVQAMCQALLRKDFSTAESIRRKLQPLFEMVTVTAHRDQTVMGRTVADRFPNPMPIKTAMNILGMPAGPCREPLGKMSAPALQKVRDALASVWQWSPEVLLPIEEFFASDIGARLKDDNFCRKFAY